MKSTPILFEIQILHNSNWITLNTISSGKPIYIKEKYVTPILKYLQREYPTQSYRLIYTLEPKGDS